MNGVTIYEFDALCSQEPGRAPAAGMRDVPPAVFAWLERTCLLTGEHGSSPWLRLLQRGGRRVVQVTSYVGIIQAPDGFHIEVLPKVGKAIDGGDGVARTVLLDMLSCLGGFRHIATENARLAAARMPLLEIFIGEFLRTAQLLVKRGLRSDYVQQQDNLPVLRGKLLVAENMRHNLCHANRFFCEHDEFTTDRAENRILHAALRRVMTLAASNANQQLGRALVFVFADVPMSTQVKLDFQRVRLDRGMHHYKDALAWARLILTNLAPVPHGGENQAPSLLFPMAALFEAFVAKNMRHQLAMPFAIKSQAQNHHLVRHQERNWFRLKPDLLVSQNRQQIMVLDTKWKLLDAMKANGTDKYGLSQGDFYQLQAYGHSYLDGEGDLVLVYPKTDSFPAPLPVFEFPKSKGLRLWVLPFCITTRALVLPTDGSFARAINVISLGFPAIAGTLAPGPIGGVN